MRVHAMFLMLASVLFSCNGAPSKADLDGTRGAPVEVFFNDPGSRLQNIWQPDVVDLMVDLIDSSQATLDFAVMGFTKSEVVEAMVRAYDRGVQVRMVGDAGHLRNSGYAALRDRHIPLVTGNDAHIMHDKFMIVDGRFVMCGTANWTSTDLVHNSNNFVVIDSPEVAADFQVEFDQMFGGVFGNSKLDLDTGRLYTIGDTQIEVWFSPNEDALGRIQEIVDGAEESLRFTIFAFTKDQVGSAFIRAQERFEEANALDGVPAGADFHDKRSVAGLIDQSQLHSNQQYHEVYRLLGAQVPLRMDGNDSSRQPGDYQAGGGRLHSKTMVIDAYGDNPTVITGSFNWSSSATQSNDEFMLVLRGKRVARAYDAYFESLWANGRTMGNTFVGEGVQPGDVTINEVHWHGGHDNDLDGFDEFIELKNHTGEDIDLDMWQIANPDDFVVGLPPGAVLPANGYYTIVDHLLEAYRDGAPQDTGSAFVTGDMVVNAFNDNRQSRLYLKDTALDLRLLDPKGELVDQAGDGGPAFTGGPEAGGVVRSMERLPGRTDGALASSWAACNLDMGGANVSTEALSPDRPEVTYQDLIRATPGEPNSNGE